MNITMPRSEYVELVRTKDRYEKKLYEMKYHLDAIVKGGTKIVVGNEEPDINENEYDIDTIVRVLRSIVYDSLGLNVPSGKEG